MAIVFGGEFTVPRKRNEVYAFLTEPHRFAPLLPEFKGLSVEDEKNFTVQVNVGISHIRGAASVKLQLAQADPPRHALYQGRGSLSGGNVDLTASFDLEEASVGTRVAWKGQAEIHGRLISLAGGLLEPLAKKNVEKLIEGLQKALSGTT